MQLALTDATTATSSAVIHPRSEVVIKGVTYDRSAILRLSAMPAGASQAAKNEIVLTLLEAYGRGELGNTDLSLDIAQAYEAPGGFGLGECVSTLRSGKGVDRAMRSDLEKLSFVWHSARSIEACANTAFLTRTPVLERLAASGGNRWSGSENRLATQWLDRFMDKLDEDLLMNRDKLSERLRWAATLCDKAHAGPGGDWAREAAAKAKRVLEADRPSAAERAAYKARKAAAAKAPYRLGRGHRAKKAAKKRSSSSGAQPPKRAKK